MIMVGLLIINLNMINFASNTGENRNQSNTEVEEEVVNAELLLLDPLFEYVFNSEVVTPMTDIEFQQFIDDGKVYFESCYVDNGMLFLEKDADKFSDLDVLLEIAKILAVHADENGKMLSIGTDRNRVSVCVWYGEYDDKRKKFFDEFAIGFRRKESWAAVEKIMGKTYPIVKDVVIRYIHSPEILKNMRNEYSKIEYMLKHGYSEINVYNALYDGLHTLDSDISDQLFKKIVNDYCYTSTYNCDQYGSYSVEDKTQYQEWFEIESQKIFKMEDGFLSRLRYMFLEKSIVALTSED